MRKLLGIVALFGGIGIAFIFSPCGPLAGESFASRIAMNILGGLIAVAGGLALSADSTASTET